MHLSLLGKVVAITGAPAGIGLACTKACLDAGAKVALIHYDEKKLKDLCGTLGKNAYPVVVDVTKPSSVNGMMSSILKQTGGLDIFIANAGRYMAGQVADGNPDEWDKMIDLNVNAVFRGVNAVLPHMIEKKTGDVIIISSISGLVTTPDEPVYCATKHAVQAFAHGVRRQVGKHGVRVASIQPGPVATKLLKDWPKDLLKKVTDIDAVTQADEVAECVVFMATRKRSTTIRDLVLLPTTLDK